MQVTEGNAADLLKLAEGAFAGERDPWANAANAAALVFECLPDLNWAGFYFLRGGELVVGPFQGRVACVRIPVGAGVCGAAAVRRATMIVPDVHAFPGHIACDSASNSEIVVPLRRGRTPHRRARPRQPAARPLHRGRCEAAGGAGRAGRRRLRLAARRYRRLLVRGDAPHFLGRAAGEKGVRPLVTSPSRYTRRCACRRG